MKPKHLLFLASIVFSTSALPAAELTASDSAAGDSFYSMSLSGSAVIVGVPHDDDDGYDFGSAYVFRNLDVATGSITENVKLTASDGAEFDYFGISASLSGTSAIVGARYDDDKGNDSGSAYVFRNLDTATGSITESVKLTASDGKANGQFGESVSLFGSTAIVGAYYPSNIGSAYVFRNLDMATGSITENLKLTASDGAGGDYFGNSVSLSDSIGLVGARLDRDNGVNSGSAYVFRNLDTATGSITESVKLTASDGKANDQFGSSVSLSGSIGLVGAWRGGNSNSGAAYVFRNLEIATGTITENVKLTASDGVIEDNFGNSVSLSGTTAIVGAYGDDDDGMNSGSAYVFRNLDTAVGSIIENVKITASDGAAHRNFGRSVSLDGDLFVVATGSPSASKAYTGSVSSMTTLDAGNASRTIDGISFVSQDDWIIGRTTDNNTVTLTAGDTADVTSAGRAVHIGKEAGSDDNALVIAGTFHATEVYIGAHTGNTGNVLELQATSVIDADVIRLAAGNFLRLEGDHTLGLLGYLDDTDLQVWDSGAWQTVDGSNQDSLIAVTYDSGFTTVGVIPEPSALLLTLLGGVSALRRRRK
ncbi:MAG: PEP-CTERM sorting domain-containing protein [Akkermansiaceae bacterium]|nr:PEP-CTERM sorting domain-containing protein [Akkermansiaceae bacterium]